MTFKEYLEQTDPVRMPHVEIKLSDCEIITIHARRTNIHAMITLCMYDKVFQYALLKDCNQLRTTDEHGNPKNLSCFHFADNIPMYCKNKDSKNITVNGLPQKGDIHGLTWNQRTVLNINIIKPKEGKMSVQNVNSFEWNTDINKFTYCDIVGNKI